MSLNFLNQWVIIWPSNKSLSYMKWMTLIVSKFIQFDISIMRASRCSLKGYLGFSLKGHFSFSFHFLDIYRRRNSVQSTVWRKYVKNWNIFKGNMTIKFRLSNNKIIKILQSNIITLTSRFDISKFTYVDRRCPKSIESAMNFIQHLALQFHTRLLIWRQKAGQHSRKFYNILK